MPPAALIRVKDDLLDLFVYFMKFLARPQPVSTGKMSPLKISRLNPFKGIVSPKLSVT
jgi:hypothetical protein